MAEFQVIETSADTDLGDFSRLLWQKGVSHRIVLSGDKQYLLVGKESDAMHVALAYRSMQQGELQWPEKPDIPQPSRGSALITLVRFPVTIITVILSIVAYLLLIVDTQMSFLSQLTFFELANSGGKIVFSLPKDQPWRLITPVFLHFSIMHIVFNMLWLWDLGRRIEIVQSSTRLLGIMFVIALGSNVVQAMYAEQGIFGGMSGVIYGLLGYSWVWSQMNPQRSMQIPHSVMIFMMGWLVVCLLGFTELMGLGKVANAAHVGGLLMGLVIGFGAGLIEGKKP
ncbi:MAG: GlpG protein [Pseudohongiellaceae bacterium]|jgi:GlpG protein